MQVSPSACLNIAIMNNTIITMPFKDKERAREYHKQYRQITQWDKIKYRNNKEYFRINRKNNRERLREWYIDIKSKKICVNCGENNPSVLQFHHRNKLTKY